MKEYDISKYDGRKHKVLSGATPGNEMRALCKIDELDKMEEQARFIVPEDVFSLNSSYFSGLFQKSLKTLGEIKFRERYHFQCSEIIRENIEDGILYILNTINLLGD